MELVWDSLTANLGDKGSCTPGPLHKFSGPGENCRRNVTDRTRRPSLVTSCRPPGRLQKRPDGRTWNAGVAVRTADGSRRTADAGDEQCLRCGRNSPSCTCKYYICAAAIPYITAVNSGRDGTTCLQYYPVVTYTHKESLPIFNLSGCLISERKRK